MLSEKRRRSLLQRCNGRDPPKKTTTTPRECLFLPKKKGARLNPALTRVVEVLAVTQVRRARRVCHPSKVAPRSTCLIPMRWAQNRAPAHVSYLGPPRLWSHFSTTPRSPIAESIARASFSTASRSSGGSIDRTYRPRLITRRTSSGETIPGKARTRVSLCQVSI